MLWITYKVRFGGGSQLDREPNTFYAIGLFDDELKALRYANRIGAKAVLIMPGQTLEEAIDLTKSGS